MTESRSWRSQDFWMGVRPPGSPCPTEHRLEHKARLVKENQAPALVAGFFYPRPVLPAPAVHGLLVLLPGTTLRLLAAPAHGLQDAPDVGGMVGDAEVLLDDFRHPRQRPEVGGVAMSLGTLEQEASQLLPVVLGQSGAPAGMAFGRESLPSGSLVGLLRAADRAWPDAHAAGHLAHSETLLEHGHRPSAVGFSESDWRSNGWVDIHALRYTYVTALIRAGVNLKVVQELAGHSTLETTLAIYAQVFRMDKRAGVEKLPWTEKVGLRTPRSVEPAEEAGLLASATDFVA